MRQLLRYGLLTLAAFGLSSCEKSEGGDPANAASYSFKLALKPEAGAPVQKLMLPPEAQIALRRADKGDVRVFDGRGKMLPIALVANFKETEKSQPVPVYPIVGATGAVDGAKLSITINNRNVAQVVGVETAQAAPQSGGAALLDVRAIQAPVAAITLEMDVPPQQPVPLTLHSSANLKDWEPLAEKMLFKPDEAAAILGGGRLDIPALSLRDHYIKASWTGATAAVKSASVITSQSQLPARKTVPTRGAELANAHEIRFGLDLPAPPAALKMTLAKPDGIIPTKLYGRNGSEDAWTLLSAATLRQNSAGPEAAGRNLIDLPGTAMKHYRIEADKRTSGFSALPEIEVQLEPTAMLVALNGVPPYTLTAGLAGAPSAYLNPSDIAPGETGANAPTMMMAMANPAPISIAPDAADDGAALGRKSVLWLVLLLGTAVLGFALYRLIRSPQAADPAL